MEVNRSLIRELLLLRGEDHCSLSNTLMEMTKINDPYLNFVLYIGFHDVCGELTCPRPFNILMRSRRIVGYLFDRLVGTDVLASTTGIGGDVDERTHKRMKISTEGCRPRDVREETAGGEGDCAGAMEFLLSMEKSNKEMAYVDVEFIASVISRISETRRIDLVRSSGITPLSIMVMRTVHPNRLSAVQAGVVGFLEARDMSYEEGFVRASEMNMDFRGLRRMFLGSGFPEIQGYFHTLVDFYPEMMFGTKRPSANRLEMFMDPLSIPKKPKVLCAYIPAVVHFIRRRLESSESMENLDVLVKVIYIERILSRCPRRRLLEKVVHRLILDTPVLVRVMVERGFETSVVRKMVKYVPSLHLAYDMSLKMLCRCPESPFYLELTGRLLRRYPTSLNIEKFKSCTHLFQESFSKRFEHLFK